MMVDLDLELQGQFLAFSEAKKAIDMGSIHVVFFC